jgi:hypothetical protein
VVRGLRRFLFTIPFLPILFCGRADHRRFPLSPSDGERVRVRGLSFFSLTIPFLLLLLSGCAYQLGPTNGQVAGSKTVRVKTFQNDTFEPRLSEPLATALRRAIQHDGTYKLTTHGSPDVILEGKLFDFSRSGLTFQPADILTVRDYYLNMRAHVKALDAATGKLLWEGTFDGHTIIRVGSDLSSAERQAVPLMADDMAQNITSRLVDGSF